MRSVAPSSTAALLTAAALFRFIQVDFVERLFTVGSQARLYGNALQLSAFWSMLAFLALAFARYRYARACRFALLKSTPARMTKGEWMRALTGGVFLALLFQLLSITFAFTVVAIPLLASLGSIAVIALEQHSTLSTGAILKRLPRYSREGGVIAGLLLVFGAGFIVAAVNLVFAFELIVWLLGGVPLFDAARWAALLSPANRMFFLAILGGAFALLEPFWIAAHAVYVHALEAQESGDDLRSWFRFLSAEDDEVREPA